VDHINCRCNVGHTKESNAETFQILKSEPILTIHKVSCFPLFHQYRIYPDYIIRKPWCVPDYIIRTAFVSSGRWSAPQRKRFGRCIAFLTTINGFSTLLSYKYHPSPPPFLTQTSPNLSSSSFYNDVFPSLVFHRKMPLWKSIRGYMISQQVSRHFLEVKAIWLAFDSLICFTTEHLIFKRKGEKKFKTPLWKDLGFGG